jgi:hypothetical protein
MHTTQGATVPSYTETHKASRILSYILYLTGPPQYLTSVPHYAYTFPGTVITFHDILLLYHTGPPQYLTYVPH